MDGLNANIKPNLANENTNLEQALGLSLFPENAFSSGNIHILDSKASLQLSKSLLNVKANGKTQYGDQSGNFVIDFHEDIDSQKISAELRHFPVALFDAVIASQKSSLRGLATSFLGETLDLNIVESRTNGIDFSMNVVAPRLRAKLEGKYDSDKIIMTSPASFQVTLSPELIAHFVKPEQNQWQLAEKAQFDVLLNRLIIPVGFLRKGIDSDELDKLDIQFQLGIPKLSIVNIKQSDLNTLVDNMFLEIKSGPQLNQFSLNISGKLTTVTDMVELQAFSIFPKPTQIGLLPQALASPAVINVSCKDFPTLAFDMILGTKPLLTDAIGKEVSFQIATNEDSKAIKLSLQSAKVEMNDMELSFDKKIKLDKNFLDQGLSGNLRIKDINFKTVTPTFSLSKLQVPWKVKKGLQDVSFSFNGEAKGANQRTPGKIQGQANLTNLKSEQPSVSLQCHCEKVPSKIFELLTSRPEISHLFGNEVDLDADGQLTRENGKLRGEIIGNKGKIKLRSVLKSGVLELEEPLTASFEATPELGSEVLGKAMPLFKDLIQSDNPISIVIEPAGFAVPLFTPSLNNIAIGKAVIKTGKMSFSNSGELRKMLGLLNTDSQGNEVSIWATPIYLSMNEGLLKVSRVDMLLTDRFPIAVWGNVDFAGDNLDFIIGITGQALSYAFRIPEIDQKTILQIPLKGRIRNAKIDQVKAASRMAAILAKYKAGAEGLMLGTVLDIANGKQHEAPDPTTWPLPWEGQLKQNVDSNKEEKPKINKEEKLKKNKEKKEKSTSKEIEKRASKLLNKIFS